MNKVDNATKEGMSNVIDEVNAKAAAQNKTPVMYLAEQSDGLRQMFIRWHREGIEQLEKIKSIHK